MRAMPETQAELTPSAPRGYFPEEPAKPETPETPLVSKTGASPEPYDPSGNLAIGGVPLPAELYEDRALIVLALRLEGYTYQEIQDKTGLSANAVRYACRKARAAGKLRDVVDLIDNEAVPQAVENLITLLRANDKDATFKVLEGRGVLRKFSNNRNDGGGPVSSGPPPLQINIISPDGGALPTVIVNSERGSVVGTARGELGPVDG